MLLIPSFRPKAQRRRQPIKCDETKPACERCTDKGLKCPGFPSHPKLRWSVKHEVFGLRRSTVEAAHSQTSGESCNSSSTNNEAAHLSLDLQPESDGARQQQRSDIATPHSAPVSGVLGETGPGDASRVDTLELQSEINDEHKLAEQNSYPSPHSENTSTATISPTQDCMMWWPPCDDVQADETQDLTTNASFQHLAVNDPPGSNVQSDPLDGTNDTFTTTTTPEISQADQTQLHSQLTHLDTGLVEAYFLVVCPIFSTFDSQRNQFRTFVGQKWHSSVPMYNAILSMAAAKLSWQNPTMKVHALEYQSMALKSLHSALSSGTGETLSTELLFVVLLLGLSACWHEISDLGTMHLRALQHAITANRLPWAGDESQHLDFFKEALVYWQMVACLVDDDVPLHDYSSTSGPSHRTQQKQTTHAQSFVNRARITPHPWAGVATAPQAIFSRIVRHIRSLRSFHPAVSGSSALLSRPSDFLETLNTLEEELWTLDLPQLHEIANTGDENTPAIHHLLLAEAYMFACLYQLYYIFPNLRRKRIRRILAAEEDHVRGCSCRSWTQSHLGLWSCLLKEEAGGGPDEWLNFLGSSIINRLEQVHITSGTACVHALLLLVGAGSLCVRPELQGSDAEGDILRSRQFVLDRISALASRMLSAPLLCVAQAVSEIFKRLDLGVNVFWMDVLQSMGIVTIIG
ncbi:uncharacterized protein PV07_04962 [Cladophialophora immunda]|uniref:Zn(2)-C6 fungal-type domain-containing protein n=1 Tax=Cladophialophora immunda TaxID=569365 RepID=A0A0D2CFX1_9EURO|nr:uncharacterized protein PV07_04962 [Cladophialophora immunda]KIW29125.1 hypothetical protein PV07_04962 [Cladophialophora immunda]